jgi:hypothetical protein
MVVTPFTPTQVHQPQVKSGSGTGQHLTVHRARQWRCTSSVAVPRLFYCIEPRPGGHHPRVGGATEQGVAVPLGQHPESGFATFIHGSTSPLQIRQHHKCFTIMCKCVSIFTNIFPKELVTQLVTPLDPSNDAKLDHSSSTR